MKALEFTYGSKDVQDLISLFQEDRLNLEPGFQRQSVWTLNDRKKLILSILQNYPIPSVFLYKTVDGRGRLKYDVLDGKQRIESILMFAGLGRFKRHRFELLAQIGDEDESRNWNWNTLRKSGHEHRISGYRISTVEVAGELTDIIDLFVRINSTGKRLTSQEKRHAKYYSSDFLKAAGKLGRRYLHFFVDNKILPKGQINRMKHIELICELMASIHMQQLLNKKTALDKIISGESIDGRSLKKCSNQFVRTLNLTKRVFPNLRSTRFSFSAEFYSLFMMIREFDSQNMILTDPKRNRQAQELLSWMSNGVDDLRNQISKGKGTKASQQLFSNYLFTTRGDSDSSITRKRRADVLTHLFAGLFERKDSKRGFNKEQRRLLWNSDEAKICTSCGNTLTWDNFTIDHIKPHSLGGPSELKNAALMCRSCNSKKGARRPKHRK